LVSLKQKTILWWEMVGAAVIIVVGSAMHFVFEWSGGWRPIAWLAAVNESTWEHFKLGFWPALIFAFYEFPGLKRRAPNFWIGKAACLWSMPLVIGTVFYGYKAVLGRHYLWADILLFVIAAVLGQFLSFKILTARPLDISWKRIAVLGIIVLLLAFALFTYFPPQNFLFVDPRSGGFGIPI
jgi:hypothetical protein